LQKCFGVSATLVGIALLVAICRVRWSRNPSLGLRSRNADFLRFFGAFGSPNLPSASALLRPTALCPEGLQAYCTDGCGSHGNSPHVSEESARLSEGGASEGRDESCWAEFVSQCPLEYTDSYREFVVHAGSFQYLVFMFATDALKISVSGSWGDGHWQLLLLRLASNLQAEENLMPVSFCTPRA